MRPLAVLVSGCICHQVSRRWRCDMPRPVPDRAAVIGAAADPQMAQMVGLRGLALAWHPADCHPAGSPRVPVCAQQWIEPPVKSLQLSVLGERRSEAFGERWDDYSAEAGTIAVARARVLVDGRVIEKEPKSARGVRTLPLDAATLAALKDLRQRQRKERLAAGKAYTDSGYVAVDELGAPMHPERYSGEFTRLCKAAGLRVIRLHDLRHSANSLMADAGVPPHIRAAWCGHTPEVNQATYTHATDLSLAAAALGSVTNL